MDAISRYTELTTVKEKLLLVCGIVCWRYVQNGILATYCEAYTVNWILFKNSM